MQVTHAQTLRLVGQACSGLGEGAGFTALDWVRRECLQKLGFDPYPGTFNLRMGGTGWDEARCIIDGDPGIPITPAPGFCAAKCFRVVIGGRITGAVVFPEVAGYPADKFEVIAAVPVRQALGLADGDEVAISLVHGT
jgi:CTP-dependent riboflavin kinase